MRLPLCLLLALCLAPVPAVADAPDPTAPARDNVPRIWRALSGDRMELDGREMGLRGVECPAPDSDRGRQAKALLNTFLRGTRNSRGIRCQIWENGEAAQADCTRNGQRVSEAMIASGLCWPADQPRHEARAPAPTRRLALDHPRRAPRQIGYWWMQTCLGPHPDSMPPSCRLSGRPALLHHGPRMALDEPPGAPGRPAAPRQLPPPLSLSPAVPPARHAAHFRWRPWHGSRAIRHGLP